MELLERDYVTAEQFRNDYLAVKLLSKYTGLQTGIDTRAVALEKFFECERKCAESNDRLSLLYASNDLVTGLLPDTKIPFRDICHVITGKIANVLRELPTASTLLHCTFGPGATTRVAGTKTSAYEKFRESLHTTREAVDFIPVLNRIFPRFPRSYEIVPGSKVTFVPKNAKTDRPIAIEPDLNIFVQLGIGNYMTRSLLRAGVDLRDQSRNQRLSRQGSIHGDVATVDMSSASDLISQAAVMYLLPHPWYILLDAARSHRYSLDGKTYVFHKFSSMGNGFTFPLQSLLFLAFARYSCELSGVSQSDVAVYGDDIIVPTGAYRALGTLLSLFGFEINARKSFASGPFRESCGKDYYDGVDVQPFYLREEVRRLDVAFKVHNQIAALASRSFLPLTDLRDSRFRSLLAWLRSSVPKQYAFRIPLGWGDGGFVSSFEEACPSPLRADGWVQGWFFSRLCALPIKYAMTDPDAMLRFALFTAGRATEPSLGYAIHRNTTKMKKRRELAYHWPALGVWV
jgi:hypothetical protein